MVLYTSFPVYAPLDHDGTGLLKPGQQQYGVLGQLYGKVHITDDHEIIAGRYLYDTPFIGPHDNRMSPKTFYGYVLHGTFGNPDSGPSFRYGTGYIAAMKERNATDFVSMSQAAGAVDPRGTGVFGGVLSWGALRVGAVEYYTQDTINIAYAEAKYGVSLTPDLSAILSMQFADERNTGANLLNAGVPRQQIRHEPLGKLWLVMEHADDRRFVEPHDGAFCHCRGCRQAQWLARQTALANEIPLPMDCDNGFLPLFGDNADLDLALLNVKDRIGGVALGKNDLAFLIDRYRLAVPHFGEKGFRIKCASCLVHQAVLSIAALKVCS